MKKLLIRGILGFFGFILLLTILLIVFVQFGIFHPGHTEEVEVQQSGNFFGSQLGNSFKVLSYNVQYFAGKDYVFFYDVEGFQGPDIRPSSEAIDKTLHSIANLILEQNPDVVLLQEVDEGAKRTDHLNQTEQLLQLLGGKYPYYAEAYYWKAIYVPHPKIAGSVGMKLTTLSKAPILKAVRHQLPRIRENPISRAFNFKRAILETHVQTAQGGSVILLNTHLDAFAHSPETMLKQVQKVDSVVSEFEAKDIPWVIGGDFNLLPPVDRNTFQPYVAESYSPDSEIRMLYEKYQAIPSLDHINSENSIQQWLTHFPNDPKVNKPDRIIDYYFYGSKIQLERDPEVVQGKTWEFSDHLPIVATFSIKKDL